MKKPTLSIWRANGRQPSENQRDHDQALAMTSDSNTAITSPQSASGKQESFAATTSSSAAPSVVRFSWGGKDHLGLKLARANKAPKKTMVVWNHEPLGITFGVDDASKRVVVTKSSRNDVSVGFILERALNQEITDANFEVMMAKLKKCHEISQGIPFEFTSTPSPVFVQEAGESLRAEGINTSFELVSVGGDRVRYLSMEQIRMLIQQASKPCEFVFCQRITTNRSTQHGRASSREYECEAATAGGLAAVAVFGVC